MPECPFHKIFGEGESFTPVYPKARIKKMSRIRRFVSGYISFNKIFSAKSYDMKMGEITTPRYKSYIINQIDLINKVLLNRNDEFPKHQIMHEMLKPLLGESVFSTNGDKWREQREMVNPAFAHANLRKVFDMMQEAAKENAAELEGTKKIDPIMTHVTADIIFRTILSRKLSKKESEKIYRAFNLYQKYSIYYYALRTSCLPTFPLKMKMQALAKKIHKTFNIISKPRHEEFHRIVANGKTPPNNDILDALMAAKSSKTGNYFSYKDITDQLSIIFLAGHETSATTLTWCLYLLSQTPKLQEELFIEISSIIKNGKIDFENIKKLEGVNNLFNEALRLYPPVSFLPREATQNLEMRGKKIKKGDIITISPWLLHRNSNYWKAPHDFNMARWSDENEKESIKECFIPFGKGERLCIGAGFARQEAILILSHIIYNYQINFPEGQKIKVLSRLTTRPKKPIILQFSKRQGN